jgi:hypothetical protein
VDVKVRGARIGELPLDCLFEFFSSTSSKPIIIASSSKARTASVRLRNWSGTSSTSSYVSSPWRTKIAKRMRYGEATG